jgi:hypothetical protein
MTKTKAVTKTIPTLPEGIIPTDLKYPHSADKTPRYGTKAYAKWIAVNRAVDQFDLWYTVRFGWCIPTLHIRNAGRRQAAGLTQERTYAVEIKGGGVVTIGLGPHVTARVTVYVTEGRRVALQPLIDLRTKGQGDAGSIRDRISTRRARSSMRRFSPWDV